MTRILTNILSLSQYIELLRGEKELDHLISCPHCGKGKLWRHGQYHRKLDRSDSAQLLNPIPIQRYLCPSCKRTCSILPECSPPKRWYLWDVQQAALLLTLAGKSLRDIANKIAVSRHTVKRWITRFQEQYRIHKDVLSSYWSELACSVDFVDFWLTCLQTIPLSKAMYVCSIAGVCVP
jgi:transposase-like protein